MTHRCRDCPKRRMFSLKTGTVMQGSAWRALAARIRRASMHHGAATLAPADVQRLSALIASSDFQTPALAMDHPALSARFTDILASRGGRTDRASRVATASLFHACRRQYPGGADRCARRSLPGRWQPSPLFGRVGLRIARFEACSTFTRVAARMVAKPPRAARCTGVLQPKSLPPSTAPIATGWSDSCRAGFAPARRRRLPTAHRISQASLLR